MDSLIKYPKTYHHPNSPGLQNDDKRVPSVAPFEGQEVVITEKMDGENASLYRTVYHARSLDGRHHPSRDWIKAFHGSMSFLIPEGHRFCGENMYAEHSIRYEDLESYFYLFSIWKDHLCLSWDDTMRMVEDVNTVLGGSVLVSVPVLYRGEYSESVVDRIVSELNTERQEGIVIRRVESFTRDEAASFMMKWVRDGHVQTDEHWMHKPVVPNDLRNM